MAQSDVVDQAPKAMTAAEVAATIAALPAKKDALREAFDRLAACSPFPLPFAWDDLDAHISSIQSSISLRSRQLQVLEAARSTSVLAPVPTGEEEESEEEVEEEEDEEVVEEEVEVEEEDGDEEEVEEVEEEEEEVEEVEEEEEEVEEEVEVEEEEEEVEEVEDEDVLVDANNVVNKEHKADEEMLEAEEEKVKEHEESVASDEADDKEHELRKVEEGEEEEEEESDGEMEETGEAKKVLSKGVYPVLQAVDKHLLNACATMNAASLVNIVFKTNICARREYHVAICHAKDAAALILDVVRQFLPHEKTKNTQVWENVVRLIRCVPLVEPECSVHTTQQAKQLAKDWKKMIDNGEICGDLGCLASWTFLYFLVSYNIVSEFDVNEIIRLFGTVPHKYQSKGCIHLCKGLGLVSRISDLIDYLIGNGQQLSAIQMTRVFKLVDKYPPISLLEGYVKKAKRTALELLSKNVADKSLNPARSKEIENLRVAHTMVKQQHADSSKSVTILEEINNLLAEYAESRKSMNASAAPNKQQKNQPQKEEQKFKKRKKEQQQHEEQDRQVQGKQRKLEGNQEQPQEKRQQLPQCKPQESKDQQRHENKGQQHHNEQAKKQKRQHLNQPRPCITKLATPVGPSPRFVPPAVPSGAHISPIGHQPFAVMHGASQPRFPWIQGGHFAANVVPPQYYPFQQNPLYHHSSFYPR